MPKVNKSINNRNLLLKIKSKYILRQIFDNIQQIRKLNIIRYNKNIKKSLDVVINDYIIEYSKIEIEIFPDQYKHGKFINIANKKNESYFHIYFNDQKEEAKTKRINRWEYFGNETKIRIVIDHKIKSLFQLFKGCKCIKKINFIKFNRNDIKNFSQMFEGCLSLEELDISKLIMEKATDMSHMFSYCTELKELRLPNFNTNNVTNLFGMFYKCSSLEKINLTSLVVDKVENMSDMFYECSSLTELDINHFNTTKLTEMHHMFYKCSSLKELNISNF